MNRSAIIIAIIILIIILIIGGLFIYNHRKGQKGEIPSGEQNGGGEDTGEENGGGTFGGIIGNNSNCKKQYGSQAFWDIGKKSCWKCPPGYNRTWFNAVDSKKACKKGAVWSTAINLSDPNAPKKFEYTYDNNTAGCKARFNTSLAFWDIGKKSCWKCPPGYDRTMFYAVDLHHIHI